MGNIFKFNCDKDSAEKVNRKKVNIRNDVKDEEIIKVKKIKKVDNNFYDISLKINSLKDISHEGWKINLKDNIDYKNEFLKIGIIGETKKGKTYILQKLLNSKIDNGIIIKIKGLGIKYHENLKEENNMNNYLILDTEGIEKPLTDTEKSDLLINNNIEANKIEDMTKERLLKELFLQHFIIKYSDIPILVVDEIKFSEQKLISKIQNILKNIKKQKKLFVIHNLHYYTNIKDVKDYIKDILLQLTGISLKERNIINTDIIKVKEENEQKNSIYYEQELNNETYKIIHLIMANEDSEAGDYYNNFAIEYLKKHFNHFTDISQVSIPDILINNFIELSASILNESIHKDQFNITKTDNQIIIKFKDELTYKKHIDYQFETFNLYNNVITPEYRYYIYNNQFIIELEIAGKTKDLECTQTFKNGNYYFNFTGKKIDDLKNNLEFKDYYSSINNDILKLNLTVSSEKIILKSEDYNYEDCGNGIHSFKFELYQKSNNKKTYE